VWPNAGTMGRSALNGIGQGTDLVQIASDQICGATRLCVAAHDKPRKSLRLSCLRAPGRLAWQAARKTVH